MMPWDSDRIDSKRTISYGARMRVHCHHYYYSARWMVAAVAAAAVAIAAAAAAATTLGRLCLFYETISEASPLFFPSSRREH